MEILLQSVTYVVTVALLSYVIAVVLLWAVR